VHTAITIYFVLCDIDVCLKLDFTGMCIIETLWFIVYRVAVIY